MNPAMNNDNAPPAYDMSQPSINYTPIPTEYTPDVKKQVPEPTTLDAPGSSSSAPRPTRAMDIYNPAPTVFNYVNPRTGQRVASLLPPDHPEMVCLQAGEHVPETKFGLLGILVAVFWFPLGVGLCLLDRKVKCSRCNAHIEDGLCS